MSHSEMPGRRTVCVALAPEMLSAEVRSGERIVGCSEIRIAESPCRGGYDGALVAFRAYLGRAHTTLRGVPLSVAISARWCHFSLLPWNDALMYDDSAQRYLQAHFAALHGQAALGWVTSCADAQYGQARLAWAIEREFMEGLQGIAQHYGHACVAVEPIAPLTGFSSP
ncbi:MAG: hypothetical protein V4631_13085 [Pseudomonadota bacterium]